MKILNDQGIRPAVIDCVAPFLRDMENILPLFHEPEVNVGDGAVTAALYLKLKKDILGSDVLGEIIRISKKHSLEFFVSSASGSQLDGSYLRLAFCGFIIF